MKCNKVIEREGLFLLSVQDDFNTSEAMFINSLCGDIIEGKAGFKVVELKRPDIYNLGLKSIPILVIAEKDYLEGFNIDDNVISKFLLSEISINSNNINLYTNKNLLAEKKFSLNHQIENPIINSYKEELFYKKFTDHLFIVCSYGKYIFIIPKNPIYFNEEEIKKADKDSDYYWKFKKTLLTKSNKFLNELRERKKDLSNFTYELIRSLDKNNNLELTAIFHKTLLGSKTFIGFIDKEMNKKYLSTHICPFYLSDERIIENEEVKLIKPDIIFKMDIEIEEEIANREILNKEKEIALKEFEKAVSDIKDKDNYFLSSIEKIEGEWKIFYKNVNKGIFTWYSLDELKRNKLLHI